MSVLKPFRGGAAPADVARRTENRIRMFGKSLTALAAAAAVVATSGTLIQAQTGTPLLQLQGTSNSIAFGSQPVGVTSPARSVVITNGGTAPLSISGVAIGGLNAGDFRLASSNCSGALLVPGGTCVASVTFRAGALGSRSGRLIFTDNASGSPHLVGLVGSGLDPAARPKIAGPVDLRFGFPAFYQDQNGLALAPCIDDAVMCLTPVPDLTRAPALTDDPATTNFNDEFFYYDAEATFPALPGKSLVRLVLEGAFNTTEMTIGEQIVFGRIRIRISGLKAGTSYKVSHPYGSKIFVAEPDVVGGKINDTEDIGGFGSPSDFTEVLNAKIFPFLTWLPNPTNPADAPPAGFIGDPTVLHRIKPGPGGDFIRIEELNAAGGVVARVDETNLWTVSGRKSAGAVAPQTPNQPPVAGDDTGTSVNGAQAKVDALQNDIDPDGDPIQISSIGAPGHGTAELANNGAFIFYTPDAGFAGTDSFTYTIDDFRGGSATATITITVQGAGTANLPPVATPDVVTAITATPTILGVLQNDTDPEGTQLTIVSKTNGAHGTVVVNGGLTVTYTSAGGYTGPDQFTYTISDGVNTASTTVDVTVTAPPPPNRAPVANPDAATTTAGVPVNIAVLANDTDPDGDALVLTTVGNFVGGVAGIQLDGTVTFTPAAGFTGGSFTYVVGDGLGLSATGTVTISTPNVAPTARADSATTTAGAPVTISVLANDTDPNGDPLLVTSVSALVGGTAVINAGSTVTFTPAAGFTGAGSFSYAITDGRGGVSSASVSVTVNPAAAPNPTVQTAVFSDGTGARTTAAFSTAAPGILVALVGSDGPTTGVNSQNITVSGAGLSWTRVQRAATSRGVSEIWTATAPAALTGVTVTSTQSVTLVNNAAVNQSLYVVAFANASGVGASNIASNTSTNATVNVVAQAAGSLVFGVGNDFDRAVARTAGAGQTKLHEFLAPTGDTFWMQRVTAPTTGAGQVVTVNATAAGLADQWNIAAVEIRR